MKALEGHTYAQVIDGVLDWIFTSADLSEWDDAAFVTVDISTMSPKPTVGQLWNGTAFYTPAPPALTLDEAKSDKITELSSDCKKQIYAGFSSSALGAAYHYPAGDKDQVNLSARVTRSLYPSLPSGWVTQFLCADSAGVWAYRDHTAAQIQQVGSDADSYIGGALLKNAQLAGQVNAIADSATAISDVQAIVWTYP